MNRVFYEFLRVAFLVIGLVIMPSSCERDKILPREYPRLRTLEVDHISESGSMFHSEVLSLGDSDINNYGFIWSEELDPKAITEAEKVIINEKLESNKFSATILTTLIANINYYVRSFVETDDFIVYGNIVSFLSLGSSAPVIHSFSPARGTWGDTLTIRGERFSHIETTNIGFLGEVKLEAIYASDTLVKFIIPEEENYRHVSVAIEIAGNRAKAEEQFDYITPSILGLSSDIAGFGDTIIIYVDDYSTESLEIQFDEITASVLEMFTEGIKVIIPCALENKEPVIRVRSSGFVDKYMIFSLIKPLIFNVSPTSAYYGDTVLIVGQNLNPVTEYNTLLFGTKRLTIISASKTEIKFLIDEKIVEIESDLQFQTGPFNLELGSFNILPAEITMLTPEVVTSPNDIITINGNGFYNSKYTLSILHPAGNYIIDQADIISRGGNEISFRLNRQQIPGCRFQTSQVKPGIGPLLLLFRMTDTLDLARGFF